MKTYKLTTADNRSAHGDMLWGPGTRHGVEGPLVKCQNGIHVYDSPDLAVLLNTIHADIVDPRLWECECSDESIDDNGLKRCCKWVETEREVPVPVWTLVQRVAFGILCSLEVYDDPQYVAWAHRWLSGEDRSESAWARAAAAAWARARSAEAACVALAAAEAAWAAACAAWAAEALAAARSEAAAAEAARAAAAAARSAGKKIDFAMIIRKAREMVV